MSNTLNEIDSRAQRNTDWIIREREYLQKYLSTTPEEMQTFEGWYNYAYAINGLPLFEGGGITPEEFDYIRSLLPQQGEVKRRGRPKGVAGSEAESITEEERIAKEREYYRNLPEYKEAEAKGWVIDFRWQDRAGSPFLHNWLVDKGLVEPGPGRGRWPDKVFMRKNGKPISAGSLSSRFSQDKAASM